ncbi:MAG: cyclohexanone monooxygenase, partial [Rhodococcus sp. (in: high G+C Gram-positive bacteria)]
AKGYPYAAKRPPSGTDYYETFNRQNVTLVDISNDPIEEITPTGLRTTSRELEFDAIVFATGFDSSTGALLRMEIEGRDGLTLSEKWKEAPLTNFGLSTAGFPNLFMIMGPQTPFANIPTCIEENVDWIASCIQHMQKTGATTCESTDEGEQRWTSHSQDVAGLLVPTKNETVSTWYNGGNVEGKNRAVAVYFGGANEYFRATRESVENGYEGFVLR